MAKSLITIQPFLLRGDATIVYGAKALSVCCLGGSDRRLRRSACTQSER